ncbi:hypothetical protein TRSC58_03523 [Trypanosoma rangeli SC58]|uniref:Uncharacterized protein n=1 Tax=Trypanosoma rangeli SC58 TaxID=429131 RepID=A0A061J1F0_TRYRA|nr:hypothetical protein TRSC58_03523 [Trypanosoma rangeli SC58]
MCLPVVVFPSSGRRSGMYLWIVLPPPLPLFFGCCGGGEWISVVCRFEGGFWFSVPMGPQSIVAKQLLRQSTLQPRLKLPAGRIVSLEEGRRLARLVHEEEEHAAAAGVAAAENRSRSSPVVLEEQVSKRILLLRRRNNSGANIKAAVAYAQRSKGSSAAGKMDTEVRDIAAKLLRKDQSTRAALKERRERSKGARRRKGTSHK